MALPRLPCPRLCLVDVLRDAEVAGWYGDAVIRILQPLEINEYFMTFSIGRTYQYNEKKAQ